MLLWNSWAEKCVFWILKKIIIIKMDILFIFLFPISCSSSDYSVPRRQKSPCRWSSGIVCQGGRNSTHNLHLDEILNIFVLWIKAVFVLSCIGTDSSFYLSAVGIHSCSVLYIILCQWLSYYCFSHLLKLVQFFFSEVIRFAVIITTVPILLPYEYCLT